MADGNSQTNNVFLFTDSLLPLDQISHVANDQYLPEPFFLNWFPVEQSRVLSLYLGLYLNDRISN